MECALTSLHGWGSIRARRRYATILCMTAALSMMFRLSFPPLATHGSPTMLGFIHGAVAQNPEWDPTIGSLDRPSFLPSATVWNGSLFVIGGCSNDHCLPWGAVPDEAGNLVQENDGKMVDKTVFGSRWLTVIDFGVLSRPNATARINMSVPIHGSSSIIAAGDSNTSSRLYTFRACSVLPFAAYADGFARTDDPIFNWSNLVDLYSMVGKVEFADVYSQLPDGGRSAVDPSGVPLVPATDDFWRLPVSIANATCVQYGFSVYIIGGVELDASSPTPKFRPRLNIDVIDLGKRAREVPTYFASGVATIPKELSPRNNSGTAICDNVDILNRLGAAASSAAIHMAFVCQKAYTMTPTVFLYSLYPNLNNTLIQTIGLTEMARVWDGQLFSPQLSIFGEHVYLTDTFSLYEFDAAAAGDAVWMIEDPMGGSQTFTGFAMAASVVDASWEEGCVLSMFAVGGLTALGLPTAAVEVTKMDDKEPSIELVTVPAGSTISGDGFAWEPAALGSVTLPAGRPIRLKMSTEAVNADSFVRVSSDPTCSSPIVGSNGEPGDFPWGVGVSTLTITIPKSVPVVYFCISNGKYADIPININVSTKPQSLLKAGDDIYYEHVYLFTCVSCSTFASADFIPTDNHPGSGTKWIKKPTSILIVAGSAGAVTLIIILLISRRFYKTHRQLMDYMSMSHREQVARLNISSSGKYQIIKKLGAGGNGEVFLVKRKDDDSGQEFAVKHVRVIGKSDRDSTLKETDLVSSFQDHPNIIQIIEMSLTEQYVIVDSADPTTAVIAKAMQIVRQRRQLLGETQSDVEETENLFQNTIANRQSSNIKTGDQGGFIDNDSFANDNSAVHLNANAHHQPDRYRPSGLITNDRGGDDEEGDSSARSSSRSSSCSSFSIGNGAGYDESTSLISKVNTADSPRSRGQQKRFDRKQRKMNKQIADNTAANQKPKKQSEAVRVRFQCVVMGYCKRSSLDIYLTKSAKKGGELWAIFLAGTAEAREKQHHQQVLMRADKHNPFIPPLSPTTYDPTAASGITPQDYQISKGGYSPSAMPNAQGEPSSYSAMGSSVVGQQGLSTAHTTNNMFFNSVYGSMADLSSMSPTLGMTTSNNSLGPIYVNSMPLNNNNNSTSVGSVSMATIHSQLQHHNPHNPHSPFVTIPEPAVVSIGIQVLSVLQHLHTASPNPVAHCDIKLANILVGDRVPSEYLTSGVPTSLVRRFGAEIEGADDRVRRMMRKQHLHHFKCYDNLAVGGQGGASPMAAGVSPLKGAIYPSNESPKPSPLVRIGTQDDMMPGSATTNSGGIGERGDMKRMNTRDTMVSSVGSVLGASSDHTNNRRESTAGPSAAKKLKDSICATFIPVVVTDLGMATECPTALAKQGSIMLGAFTVAYVPPECISSGLRQCSTKVDIWALGVTLYLIATGKFDGMEDLRELGEIERRLDGSYYKNSNNNFGKVGTTPRRHHGSSHHGSDGDKKHHHHHHHHHHRSVSVDSLEADDSADTSDQLVEVLMFEKARSQRFLQKVRIELVEMHGYSEAFSAWIESMLSVDPARRPNAAELLYRVQRVGWLEYRVLPPRVNSNQLPSAGGFFRPSSQAGGTPPATVGGSPTTGGGVSMEGEREGSYVSPFAINAPTKAHMNSNENIIGDQKRSSPRAPFHPPMPSQLQQVPMSMDGPFTLPESVGNVRQQTSPGIGLLNPVRR